MNKDYLLTPGPTPLPPQVQEALSRPIIHHRTAEYRALFKRVLQGLQQVFQTKEQVVVFTPLGFLPQACDPGEIDGWGLHGGNWQMHRSGWSPDDFDAGWLVLGCREYHLISGTGEELPRPYTGLPRVGKW